MPIYTQELPVLISRGALITSNGAPLSHADLVAMVQRMIDRRAEYDAIEAAAAAEQAVEDAANGQADEDAANVQATEDAAQG